jgi:hypothetical protein
MFHALGNTTSIFITSHTSSPIFGAPSSHVHGNNFKRALYFSTEITTQSFQRITKCELVGVTKLIYICLQCTWNLFDTRKCSNTTYKVTKMRASCSDIRNTTALRPGVTKSELWEAGGYQFCHTTALRPGVTKSELWEAGDYQFCHTTALRPGVTKSELWEAGGYQFYHTTALRPGVTKSELWKAGDYQFCHTTALWPGVTKSELWEAGDYQFCHTTALRPGVTKFQQARLPGD